MERTVGTVTRGLRCPIINEGDNIESIVVESVLNASKAEGFTVQDKDIVAITESIVARAQGNYATIDQIAKDVTSKFGESTVGVIFPIFSRNRFSNLLKGIARGSKKVILMMSYPSDEVGNHIVSLDALDEKGIPTEGFVLKTITVTDSKASTHEAIKLKLFYPLTIK